MASTDAYIRIGIDDIRIYDNGDGSFSLDLALAAARRGDCVCRWANDRQNVTATDFELVTDTDFLYNIPEGKRFMIQLGSIGITTPSDSLTAIFYGYSAVDGGGDKTRFSRNFYFKTGLTPEGRSVQDLPLMTPLPIPYSLYRSFSMETLVNDTDCTHTVGFIGYIENE